MSDAAPGDGSYDPREFSTTAFPNWPYPSAGPYPAIDHSYTVEGIRSRCASSIDDLSESRVATLKRRVESTGKPLETWGPIESAGPCHLVRLSPGPAPVAVLGSDGRYHLALGADLLCSGVHVQECSWTARSNGSSIQGDDPVEVSWPVEATDEQLEASDVHRNQRCPIYTYPRWPPFMAGRGRLANIRRTLVAEFGPTCVICGSPADKVDHDHSTGLVRGFLCIPCNSLVDTCPHVRGCKFQHYLDDPPALHLTLRYPNAGDSRSNRRARATRRLASPSSGPDDRAPGDCALPFDN